MARRKGGASARPYRIGMCHAHEAFVGRSRAPRARIVSVAAVGLADEGLGTTTVKLVTATHFSSGERDAQARCRVSDDQPGRSRGGWARGGRVCAGEDKQTRSISGEKPMGRRRRRVEHMELGLSDGKLAAYSGEQARGGLRARDTLRWASAALGRGTSQRDVNARGSTRTGLVARAVARLVCEAGRLARGCVGRAGRRGGGGVRWTARGARTV